MNNIQNRTNLLVITDSLVNSLSKKENPNKIQKFINSRIENNEFAVSFATPETLHNFLHLVCKKAFPHDATTISKVLLLFRKQFGIPKALELPQVTLSAKKGTMQISVPKIVLENLSPFFKSMFSSGFKETNDQKAILDLSDKALEAFNKYVYENSVETDDAEVLEELMQFADMIQDDSLQTKVADEKLHLEFDEMQDPIERDHIVQGFLNRKGIFLSRGKCISLYDFYVLFNRKESKILDFLAKQITKVSIDEKINYTCNKIDDYVLLIPNRYRKAIKEIDYNTQFPATRTLLEVSTIFPNAFHSLFPLHKNTLEYAAPTATSMTQLELVTEDAIPCAALAYVHCKELNLDLAEEFARRAIKIDEKNSFAYAVLGYVLSFTQEPNESEETLRKAIELDPKNSFAYLVLCKTLALQGYRDTAEIENLLQRALKIDPKSASLHEEYGQLLMKKQDYDQAENELSQATTLYESHSYEWPGIWTGHQYLGFLLKVKNKFDEAEEVLYEAFRMNPYSYSVNLDLSSILLSKNNLTEAEAYASFAINANNNSAEAHEIMGNILYKQGRLDEAEASLRKAYALDQDATSALTTLIEVLNTQGKFENAEEIKSILLEKSGANHT